MQLNESSHFQWLQLIDSILERWKFIIRENYKNAPNLVIHDDHLGGKEMWHWTKMG